MLTSLRAAVVLLLGIPFALPAEPLHVSGRLQTSTESPQGITGARVDLLPQTGETPLATARTDAAGVFELTAPESGCFRVRMRADGYVNVEALLLPLVEDLDLTPAPALSGSSDEQVTSGSPVGEEWVFDTRKPTPTQPSGAPPRLVQGKVRDLKGRPVAGALVWSEGDPGVSCARSGADGGFQIRLPAQSETKLRATAAGFFPSDPRQEPPPGRQGPPLVLTLTPAGSIPGRVVDAAGQPLGGAQITARILSTGFSQKGTWSRADGRFRLSRLPPGNLFALIATHDGFAPASVKADALSSPRPVRIVMERGATVLGKVLDPEGQPVPGAALDLRTYRDDGSIQRLLGASAGKAASDPAGSFAIPHLGSGRFELRVTRSGFATLSVPEIEVAAGAARVDLGPLTLARGSVIEGRVTDPAGAPLPEAQVTPTSAPDPLASGFSVSDIPPETSTDSEGHFRFEDLRRGARFGLRVERSGFIPATIPAVEAPTPEPLRIELKAGRTVAGRVKSPEGGPVPQAEVRVSSSSGLTDEEGRFRIAGIPPGVDELTVNAEGYPLARVEDLRIPEESDVEGLEIALHQPSVLEVQVLDSRRQPVAGILVSAYYRIFGKYFENNGPFECNTDPEGRCRVGGLDTGPYDVLAQSEKDGFAKGSVEIGPGVNRYELVLPPKPSGVLVSGQVSDETGAPVAGASLSLIPMESGSSSQATSLTDGSFQFSAVRDGAYRLSGSAPGFAAGTAPDEVWIAGQEVRGLALRLSRGATLTGRVLGLDPEALESASVSASPGAGDPPPVIPTSSSGSPTDREGRYKITDLAPGEWRVVARARGRAIQEPLQIAPGAREAVLDLRFPSGYTLTGHVTADRTPLVGARVQASSGTASFQGMTGPDGGFQIPNVPPGRYAVTATDGSLGASSTVEVTGDQEVNLDFSTGGLQVRVFAGGAPVANVFVQVADSAHLYGSQLSLADAAGRLAIPRLTSGAYTVQVQIPGFAPARVNVEVRPGAVTPVEIELKPVP
jgi:protocatechuate 3,4-dioxygenase beta subunit